MKGKRLGKEGEAKWDGGTAEMRAEERHAGKGQIGVHTRREREGEIER